MNGNHELAPAQQLEPVASNTAETPSQPANQSTTPEGTTHESALENLAKNLEAIGKYRELLTDVKLNDMIAFKVMTEDFQISDYAIGLVEELHGDTSNRSYDLTLLIMGKPKT